MRANGKASAAGAQKRERSSVFHAAAEAGDYVIIGNSAAAVGAVEAIRAADTKHGITIITDEPEHTYSRPLISYLLLGKTDEARMRYRPADFYEKNGVKLVFGRAAAIDPVAKKVMMDDGGAYVYGKLLVAAGSHPFVPPMSGLDKVKEKYTFSSLADARALEKAISKDSRVLIMGAGLIGLKCAEGILDRVKEITVVDLAPRVLPSILDEDASEYIKNFLEGKGIKFYLANSAKELYANEAVLNDGTKLSFDVLVTAVGVRPNISLVKDAGGACGKGVTINTACETSIRDVYAAGDCTESIDAVTGDTKVMALLPNAYMQGECAGTNMAGGNTVFDRAIPMNSMGLFGLHMMTAGSYTGEVYESIGEGRYKKLFYEGDRLKGFILIGDVARAGIYTALIRDKKPLSEIDFGLICESPGLMAFTREERSEKLAGGR